MREYEYHSYKVDAPLSAVAVDRGGTLAAIALGDGSVRLGAIDAGIVSFNTLSLTNDGAVLALVPDCHSGAFLAGADNGEVFRLDVNGQQRLLRLPRAWPDQLATHTGPKIRAVADAAHIRLLDGSGSQIGELSSHPSTISGMTFNTAGTHLAVSHYDGASIWELQSQIRADVLQFRGSHLSLVWQPAGRYLVTTTQEKMLHAWDLDAAGGSASLGPFFSKVRTLGWSADGNWLLAAGNDTLSAWNFASGLPAPAPMMLGRYSEDFIRHVCPHPRLAIAAVGYNDGGLEITAISAQLQRFALVEPCAAPVSALCWSPDGRHLVGGDQSGQLFVYSFDNDWLARLTDMA